MNWYKQSQQAFNVDRRELAVKLLEWHGGQGSPLYSVGSSWLADKEVPDEHVEWAIQELKRAERDDMVADTDLAELSILIGKLQQELDGKREAEDADSAAAYEAEMSRDTYKQYPDGYSVEDTSPCKDPNDKPRSNGKHKSYQSYPNLEQTNAYPPII